MWSIATGSMRSKPSAQPDVKQKPVWSVSVQPATPTASKTPETQPCFIENSVVHNKVRESRGKTCGKAAAGSGKQAARLRNAAGAVKHQPLHCMRQSDRHNSHGFA